MLHGLTALSAQAITTLTMANRVFISFKAEDKPQVDGLRLMAWNPNHDIDFYDESVRVPIDSVNSEYVKRRIREKIERAGVVLCLVNTDTYASTWVAWEIDTAIDLAKPILAMAVKGVQRATLPEPIRNRVPFVLWDPGSLNEHLASAQIVPRAF